MRALICLAFYILGLIGIAYAQSALNPNEEYLKNQDALTGRFELPLNERERMNVNYSLSPKNPSSEALFLLHTPTPMPLTANVTDASGKVVYTWKPEQQVYMYNVRWDLSKLKPGKYDVNIFSNGSSEKVFQFVFVKQ